MKSPKHNIPEPHIIDVPSINRKISEAHKKFIDNYGPFTDKVVADHRLRLYKVWNKILLIAKCFRDEGIVDRFEDCSKEAFFLTLRLSKMTVDNLIYIRTDGDTIVLTDSSFKIASNMQEPFKCTIYNVSSDDYDWEHFAVVLLDYIHDTIYLRSKAVETKVFGS